jgi:hypothetical protein
MKIRILSFSDSNMAWSSWRWNFFLEDEDGGAHKLSCKQVIADDEAILIAPFSGLRRGADVYDALEIMLAEAGNSLEEHELASISLKIGKLNKRLAGQFERGPKLLERRAASAAKRAAVLSHTKLAPFRTIIDEYVLKFSDVPLRYPGGGNYGTKRIWAKTFIEQYVVENGHLPYGNHDIKVKVGGTGYSGGTHDFSDLKIPGQS